MRVLLFIHGTFSSTAGAFAGLAVQQDGKDFLAAAARAYDAIIGYDHRTLSADPLQNATDLLQRLNTPKPPRLDVIAHSRGGLVARSLTEHLLPREGAGAPTVGRMIFVGCTNGGTLLASPEHWKAYIDLYTNLAVALSRLKSILAAPLLVGTWILRGAVSYRSGRLREVLSPPTTAASGDDVPGNRGDGTRPAHSSRRSTRRSPASPRRTPAGSTS